MEFEAVDEGTIGKILVAEGTEGVKVNTPIAVLLAEGESADDIAAPRTRPTTPKEDEQRGAPRRRKARPRRQASTMRPRRDRRRRPAQARPSGERRDGERIFASPLARRIAADKGLDLAPDQGLRPARPDREGRCRKCPAGAAQPGAAQPAAEASAAAPAAAGDGASRRCPPG